MNRRHFLQTSGSAGAALSLGPLIKTVPRIRRHRVGLIGSGWWGMNILRVAIQSREIDVVAMCDVDDRQMAPALAEVESMTGKKPNVYKDYREMLSREQMDIAIIATPDHWHALVAIAAMEAGCHLYLEKPVGHTIYEGRAMLHTSLSADRLVQVGTHRRVSPHNISGMEFLRSGKVGKIGMVRAFVHYGGGAGSPHPDSEPPEGLDWNMWCGPAPLRAYNEKLHPKGFRHHLDFANGMLGDWGIHWMDQILWWTEEKYPKKIFSSGSRHIRQQEDDAPDTQVATFEFESFTATWEHRRYAGNKAESTNLGCYFYGTKGTFHLGWLDGWTFYPSDDKSPVVHEDPKLNEPDQQNIKGLWYDLIDAIDKKRQPVCSMEVGHLSTNVSLLGMLSMKAGRSIEWDGEKEIVINDPEANALLKRDYRGPWKYPIVT